MVKSKVTIPARVYEKLFSDAMRLQNVSEDKRNSSLDEEERESIVTAFVRRKRALESEIMELESRKIELERFVDEQTRKIASDIVKDIVSMYEICAEDLRDGDNEN